MSDILKTVFICENFIFFKKFSKNIFSKLTFCGHFGQNLTFFSFDHQKKSKKHFSHLAAQAGFEPMAIISCSIADMACTAIISQTTNILHNLNVVNPLNLF